MQAVQTNPTVGSTGEFVLLEIAGGRKEDTKIGAVAELTDCLDLMCIQLRSGGCTYGWKTTLIFSLPPVTKGQCRVHPRLSHSKFLLTENMIASCSDRVGGSGALCQSAITHHVENLNGKWKANLQSCMLRSNMG